MACQISGSEYEQMRSMKLFSEKELLKIQKSREEFEKKVSLPSAGIKDFVEYIKYDRALMATIKERIKKRNITATNNTILTIFADRMKLLYAQALLKYSQNVRFWNEYIKFLQTFKYTKDISSTFEQMLKFHDDKAEVWVRAILWEYNENFNADNVRSLLVRAQQRHPDSQQLCLTSMQIELENKWQLPELETLQHADAIYSTSKEIFTNVDFYVEMINVVDKITHASSIQQKILEDLRTKFPHEEIMWHTLAQRELNGLPSLGTPVDFTGLIKDEDNENRSEDNELNTNLKKLCIKNVSSSKKRIELCVKIYEEGVKEINSAKLWNYYISTMLDLNIDLSTQPSLKQRSLERAFEGAYQFNYLSEDHFLKYIEFLCKRNRQDSKIEIIFRKATNVYDNSFPIWLQCMRYFIQEKPYTVVQEIFEIAKRKQLGPRLAEIWQLYMMYIKCSFPTSMAQTEFDNFVMDLSQQRHDLFNNLKAKVLELIAASITMNATRETYNLFIKKYPSCYEVHAKMADLEERQMIRNPEIERNCMKNLILNFGKIRTDVWLRYMRFERFAGDPTNVSELHKNALATLNRELLDEYRMLYKSFCNEVGQMFEHSTSSTSTRNGIK